MGLIRKFDIPRQKTLELKKFPYSKEMHLFTFFKQLIVLQTNKMITKQKLEMGYITVQKAYKFALNIYY